MWLFGFSFRMSAPPKVFISATSGDLRSARKVVEQALLKSQCLPVEQSNFHPDWRTLWKEPHEGSRAR